MKTYIPRKLIEKKKYYAYGTYAPYMEESVDLYGLIHKGRPNNILLLADAGLGKSTELKFLAERLIYEKSPDNIPIFVELNTYVDQENIGDFIKNQIGRETEHILEDVDKSKLLFLIDDFDQVLDKVKAARNIINFIQTYNESSFVIACRSNFYSGQFDQLHACKQMILLPFSKDDVENYAKSEVGSDSGRYISELSSLRMFELAKNPFFSKCLMDIFNDKKELPANKGMIISKLIPILLWEDRKKLLKYDITQKCPIQQINNDLERLAIIMETMQRNYISDHELSKIIVDDNKREIITQVSLLARKEFKDSGIYQFQHNIFQEYLSAEVLSKKKFKTIMEFVLISAKRNFERLERVSRLLQYVDFSLFHINIKKILDSLIDRFSYIKINRVNPSWVNTVAFLCELRTEDLFSYIVNNECELGLKFEKARLDDKKKELIFKKIFEKYIDRKTWINRDKVDCEELASFIDAQIAYPYLMCYAQPGGHFTHRYNAILLLSKLADLKNSQLDDLQAMLVKYTLDDNENVNIRHECFYALARLKLHSKYIIDKLVHLKNSDDDWLCAGVFHLIKESPYCDQYIEIILEAILNKGDSSLLDIAINLSGAIKKINTAEGIKKLISSLIADPQNLESFERIDAIENLVQNAAAIYMKEDKSIYFDITKLIIAAEVKYIWHVIPKLVSFFEQTETVVKFFREIYAGSGSDKYSLMAAIANKQCIDFMIGEYFEFRLTEHDMGIFINFLCSKRRPEDSRPYLQTIREKTGKFLPPPEIDYAEERKKDIIKIINTICDKDKLFTEIESIYIAAGRRELSYLDIEQALEERIRSEKQLGVFVLRVVMSKFPRDRICTVNEIKTIIDREYEILLLRCLYDLLHDKEEIDIYLSSKQRELIDGICRNNISNVDFTKALSVNGDRIKIVNLAIYLWYFLRKLNLKYPESTLLDMLMFDGTEKSQFCGIDYLLDKLPPNKLNERVLDNLSGEIRVDIVLQNHIKLCKKLKINEAVPNLIQIARDKSISENTRLLALEAVASFDNSTPQIEAIINSDEGKVFIEAAKILLDRNNKRCKKMLIRNLRSKNVNFALQISKLLIEYQELKGFKFYINYIISKNIYDEAPWDENPIEKVRNPKAIPILLKLLLSYIEYKDRPDQRRDLSVYGNIINSLKNIASENISNYKKVLACLRQFIKKHGAKHEDIYLLNNICDDIEDSFFINYTSGMAVDDAKNKVEQRLSIN